MQKRLGNLKEFYESKVWGIHRVSNAYEVVRVKHIISFLKPQDRDVALEIGCGGGTYTSFLTQATSIVATDVSLNAVKEAKQNLAHSSNVFFVVCDGANLPIRDKTVDKVVCIDVLEHLVQPQLAVDEVSKTLKPDGRMLLCTACGENKFTFEYMLSPFLGRFIDSIRSTLGHVSIFTTEIIQRMLSKNFTIVHVEYMHHWAGWLFKFLWDTVHLNKPRGAHGSQFETSGTALSRALWLSLEQEYRVLKNRSTGTEIIVEALRKSG